jgi:hypothetical protein
MAGPARAAEVTAGTATAANPYADGQIQHAFHMPTTCQLSAQPSQTWYASHADANDLTDFLDLGALAVRQPTFPALPPLAAPGDTAAALACSTTGPGTIPPPGSVTG